MQNSQVTRQGARDFIACVLHAIAVGVIEDNEGKILINGARHAVLSYKRARMPKEEGKPKVHPENDPQPLA